jgi:hypothetical protein
VGVAGLEREARIREELTISIIEMVLVGERRSRYPID